MLARQFICDEPMGLNWEYRGEKNDNFKRRAQNANVALVISKRLGKDNRSVSRRPQVSRAHICIWRGAVSQCGVSETAIGAACTLTEPHAVMKTLPVCFLIFHV